MEMDGVSPEDMELLEETRNLLRGLQRRPLKDDGSDYQLADLRRQPHCSVSHPRR